MHVVICGGGVIGAAIAYELACRGTRTTVIERWRVAGSASGKSGGFIARDWCRGSPLASLAERSFDLHAKWAEALGDRYGYRRVDTYSAALSLRRSLGREDRSSSATWLAPDAVHRRRIGSEATTAQLDPAAFTTTLIDAAVAKGAELVTGTVIGVRSASSADRLEAVALDDGREIRSDAVVLAMGPWTVLAAAWLRLPPVYGLKGHSVVFRSAQPSPAETVFAEIEDADGEVLGPEIVPRRDGTLYVCGMPGSAPLPLDPADVAPEPGSCERLRDLTIRLVPGLAGSEVLAMQACYRPITSDGLPLIGPVAGIANAYVATGHSVWGMLNAPATAEALADLMLAGRPRHVSLDPFLPSRLAPLDPGGLRRGRTGA